MIVRRICEKYHALPSDVENLTLDQIWLLVMDEKRLERIGGVRQTSVRALQQEGLVAPTSGGSLVQRIRAMKQQQAVDAERAGKKERKQRRREQLIRYKRERGEL